MGVYPYRYHETSSNVINIRRDFDKDPCFRVVLPSNSHNVYLVRGESVTYRLLSFLLKPVQPNKSTNKLVNSLYFSPESSLQATYCWFD